MKKEQFCIIALLRTASDIELMKEQMENIGQSDYFAATEISVALKFMNENVPRLLIIDEELLSTDLNAALMPFTLNMHVLVIKKEGKALQRGELPSELISLDYLEDRYDQFELFLKIKKKFHLIRETVYSLSVLDRSELHTNISVDCEIRGISESHLVLDSSIRLNAGQRYVFEGDWLDESSLPSNMLVTDVKYNGKGYGFLTYLYLRFLGEEFLRSIRKRRVA